MSWIQLDHVENDAAESCSCVSPQPNSSQEAIIIVHQNPEVDSICGEFDERCPQELPFSTSKGTQAPSVVESDVLRRRNSTNRPLATSAVMNYNDLDSGTFTRNMKGNGSVLISRRSAGSLGSLKRTSSTASEFSCPGTVCRQRRRPSSASTITCRCQNFNPRSLTSVSRHPCCHRRRLSQSSLGFHRHRKSDEASMSGWCRCWFSLLVATAQILLHGAMALVLYWVWTFHKPDDKAFPFAWREDPKTEFNLHPVLMIAGFIYFVGQAMLMYRTCRCCRRISNKLLHTVFHLLAIPCIVVGFIAVLDSHNLRQPNPIPNFYSLHSWMGLTAMGLFALQFVVGFFSFLLLLCCESATASFRASLVPIHSAFGITTFVLAVATACTGLTEKALFTLSKNYSLWPKLLSNTSIFGGLNNENNLTDKGNQDVIHESLVINTIGACLIGLVMVIPILVLHPKFKFRAQRIITVTTTHDRYA